MTGPDGNCLGLFFFVFNFFHNKKKVQAANLHALVQRLVSVVSMVTVLKGVLPKSSVLLWDFCAQEDSVSNITCFTFSTHL
jgi:hypothetical protein